MNTIATDNVESPHVLLVEDDADIREAITTVLELEGYRVEAASNGREALTCLFTGRRPSLILLDLTMPVMDGWEFRKRQMLDGTLADIPTVVMSGDARVMKKADSIGVVHCLGKPFRIDELISMVESCCEASLHEGQAH